MGKTFLMCEPTFYGVEYIINPHMEGNVGNVDQGLAHQQWKNLRDILSNYATVELIEQAQGMPDMVFTANAGLIIHDLNYVWVSRFAKPERRVEEQVFARWFIGSGFDIIEQPAAQMNFFEGAGDALVASNGEYWLGYGMRSSLKAVEAISTFFDNRKFHILELKDPRFYHLDTCFAPLSKGHLLWYPGAFTPESHEHVTQHIDMLIDVSEEDANHFACNSICVDNVVIMPHCSDTLVGRVKELGYDVITVNLSEFIKAGGASKCLTLQIR